MAMEPSAWNGEERLLLVHLQLSKLRTRGRRVFWLGVSGKTEFVVLSDMTGRSRRGFLQGISLAQETTSEQRLSAPAVLSLLSLT